MFLNLLWNDVQDLNFDDDLQTLGSAVQNFMGTNVFSVNTVDNPPNIR